MCAMAAKRQHDQTPKEILDQLIQRQKECSDHKRFRKYIVERVGQVNFTCMLELDSSLQDGGQYFGSGNNKHEAEQAAAQAYLAQPRVAAVSGQLAAIAAEQKSAKAVRHA